jgi:hypothetical protein
MRPREPTPHPTEFAAGAVAALSPKGRGHNSGRRDRVDTQEQDVTGPLLIEHDDGVDQVTLNRPEALNALDPALIDALNTYF